MSDSGRTAFSERVAFWGTALSVAIPESVANGRGVGSGNARLSLDSCRGLGHTLVTRLFPL